MRSVCRLTMTPLLHPPAPRALRRAALLGRPLFAALLAVLLLGALLSPAAAQDAKEQIAVLDFDVIGSSKEQGAVLSNQLRAELLKTGRFTVVNRAQLDKILDELALQQQLCTQKECAVQVGKLLGVKSIVTGTVTKITDTLWQVSVTLTNVETAEILRQEVVNHAGDFASLFLSGMATVAAKIAATGEVAAGGGLRLAPESIAPATFDVLRKVSARAVAFSHDSARLYYAVDDKVWVRNVAERRAVGQPIQVPGGDVSALAVNRTGERLAVGTRRGTVSLVDTATGKVLHSERAHSDPVTTVAFSPADNFFASGGADEKVHVFDARTGSDSYTLEGPRDDVATVRFSADGKYLIVASQDRTVRLYDVNLQREVRAFQESAKTLQFAEISGDGAYLAVAAKEIHIDLRRNRRTDTRLVKIRDVKTGEELLSFEAHDKDVTGLAFFPDTRYLASGAQDGLVKIWDLQKKASIANLNLNGRVTALGVSPNGKWLAAADDTDTLTIWQVTR
jgi:WD40 repeat protein